MVPLNQLDAKSIMSREVLDEVFGQEDEIYKAELLASLALRASELKCKKEFSEVVAAYKRAIREIKKQEKEEQRRNNSLVEHYTNFSDSPYDSMICENWIASDDGVYTWNPITGLTDIRACYHPILPIERLKNLETGEEQLKIAFKRNYCWQEIIVPKTMIASASKIVGLAARGVAVTSETAKYLVRYLSDVENANDDYIKIQYSSSKLGWIGDGFLPYDTEIVFDGDMRFKQLFESIVEHGNRELWYEHVKYIRKSGKFEIKFMLAASFASVLIKIMNALPFFVDLWGLTGNGKSVTHMLAASVWANPSENKYIGNFKSSDVGLEIKADMLNNLPMILDDTSQKDKKIEENFERIVYDLCSGQGKTRSNKELGLNRESRWSMCILTNGEYPLQSYMTQGGAVNRILEVECTHDRLFFKPQETIDILKNNYGFAGKDFVKAIKELGVDNIRKLQQEIQKSITSDDKTEKQLLSLSIVLTADRIATDMLFKDGQYIDINDAKSTLADCSDVSPNERCYEYLMDTIAMNDQRFDMETRCEKWGEIEYNHESKCKIAMFYPKALESICKEGGFSRKAFQSWGLKKKLIIGQGANATKVKKIPGTNKTKRFVFIKIIDDLDEYLDELKHEFDQSKDDGLVFD